MHHLLKLRKQEQKSFKEKKHANLENEQSQKVLDGLEDIQLEQKTMICTSVIVFNATFVGRGSGRQGD